MRGFRSVAIALAMASVAGCGEKDLLTVGSGGITGTYVLRTINGNTLPYTVQQVGNDKTDVLNETLVLAEGGTFSLQGSVRMTEAGVTTTETYSEDGTYTRDGSSVVLTFDSGTREAGTLSGGTLTLASAGFTLVYQRQ